MQSITTQTAHESLNSSGNVAYELLWQRSFLEIFYSKEWNFLKAIWMGQLSKADIIEGAEAILTHAKQFNSTKLVNDVSRVEGLFTDAVEWIVTDFSPRLNAIGVTHVAWIYSENSESRFSADAVVSHSITDTITFIFDNLSSAERWILASIQKSV